MSDRPEIPHRRHQLTLTLEADDPKAMLAAVRAIEYDLTVREETGHNWAQGLDITSGGYDSGWHLTVSSDMAVDGDAYRASLKTWHDAVKAARKAART